MKKILFIVSEDWYFISHRLHLATAAINNGYEVALLSRMSQHQEFISSLGIKPINWPLERRSRNPMRELRSIYCLIAAIRSFSPNLVYAVAIKPIIYTILSKIFFNADGIVLAFGGLGFIFRSNRVSAKILKVFITPIFRLLLTDRNIRLIVQNSDDRRVLDNLKIIDQNKTRLIFGVGVDAEKFSSKPISHTIPLVILPARMLWDKGVGDFVRCAQRCINYKIDVRFALIGDPDPHNPESIPEVQLKEWVDQGVIEWWKKKNNMSEVYSLADIVCFPSYHEGLPKTLLEAASCELPIVSYDVSGCREVVKDKVNGFLVPFKDEDALFTAVMDLLRDSSLRHKMGVMGRKMIMEKFTQEKVTSETMRVCDNLLK